MVDLGIPGLGPGRVIGGGSSTVFVATRSSFGNRIAVKLLKPTLSDEQSRKHFDRKIRALQELADAPGIAAVLDSGVSERGEPYLVLPLFDRSAQSEASTTATSNRRTCCSPTTTTSSSPTSASPS